MTSANVIFELSPFLYSYCKFTKAIWTISTEDNIFSLHNIHRPFWLLATLCCAIESSDAFFSIGLTWIWERKKIFHQLLALFGHTWNAFFTWHYRIHTASRLFPNIFSFPTMPCRCCLRALLSGRVDEAWIGNHSESDKLDYYSHIQIEARFRKVFSYITPTCFTLWDSSTDNQETRKSLTRLVLWWCESTSSLRFKYISNSSRWTLLCVENPQWADWLIFPFSHRHTFTDLL